MYNYVLYYNIEKSGFNAVSAYLLFNILILKLANHVISNIYYDVLRFAYVLKSLADTLSISK